MWLAHRDVRGKAETLQSCSSSCTEEDLALMLNASSCEGVTSVPGVSAGECEVSLLIQVGLLHSLLRCGPMGLSTALEDVSAVKKDKKFF